jgi:hypothetical protein
MYLAKQPLHLLQVLALGLIYFGWRTVCDFIYVSYIPQLYPPWPWDVP